MSSHGGSEGDVRPRRRSLLLLSDLGLSNFKYTKVKILMFQPQLVVVLGGRKSVFNISFSIIIYKKG